MTICFNWFLSLSKVIFPVNFVKFSFEIRFLFFLYFFVFKFFFCHGIYFFVCKLNKDALVAMVFGNYFIIARQFSYDISCVLNKWLVLLTVFGVSSQIIFEKCIIIIRVLRIRLKTDSVTEHFRWIIRVKASINSF